MDAASSTAICRHVDCEKRFTLSRYGNRTYTSEKTREGRHLFCSPKMPYGPSSPHGRPQGWRYSAGGQNVTGGTKVRVALHRSK